VTAPSRPAPPAPTSSGADELIDEVQKGRLDFDAVVATPDLMGKVGRLGRVLGPAGLMPEPQDRHRDQRRRQGRSEIKGGKIEFRVDRTPTCTSSSARRPSTSARWSRTTPRRRRGAAAQAVRRQGPLRPHRDAHDHDGSGIPLDSSKTRNLLEDADAASA
jgi:large subunit ribosomal protein L1